MKKWADLKCDGKRRMAALRGPNGSNLRKKNLGPVERMVHKILLMSPGTGKQRWGVTWIHGHMMSYANWHLLAFSGTKCGVSASLNKEKMELFDLTAKYREM